MMMPRVRLAPLAHVRSFALALVLCIVAAASRAASAQSAPSELEVRVTDGAGKPVANARVSVSGPLTASQLTPNDGTIRFTDVDPGLYRIRVAKSGYRGASIDEVEALAGRRRIVDARLVSETEKVIGTVVARPPITVSSVDVDDDSPIRRISENLASALDQLAGVSVVATNGGNTLSVSLRGADPSSTIATVGGAAAVGAGSGTLQAVAADLATGVSTGNDSITSVGGSVNYRTLEPTKTWQEQASTSYGDYAHFTTQVAVSGTAGKLGIAAQHAARDADSVLTGRTFTDTSGETYPHDGSSGRESDFVKLRYPIGRVIVTAQYLDGSTRNAPICDQDVTLLPCGYGAGGAIRSRASLGSVTARGDIGNVAMFVQFSGQGYDSTTDESGRFVSGVAAPFVSSSHETDYGFRLAPTIGVGRHTFSLNIGSNVGSGTTVQQGPYGGISPLQSRYGYYVAGDTYKLSDRFGVTLSDGLNQSLATSSNAADIAIAYTPSNAESLTIVLGTYGGGTFSAPGGFLTDPEFAQFDCTGNDVVVQAPPDGSLPGTTHEASLRYQRRGKRGAFQLYATTTVARNEQLTAQFPLAALPTGIAPAGYTAALASVWHAPSICGAQAFPNDGVYVAQQVADASVRNTFVAASTQVPIGRATIVQSSYTIGASTLLSGDARLLAVGSAYAVGAQLPGIPLHRASLLLDTVQRRAGLEYVANASWTSANNPANLTSYVVVAAGATWNAPHGRVSFFVNNVFDTDSALFATHAFAQPLALRGGGVFLPVPTPLAPRSATLLYSVRAGRIK